MEYQGGKTTKDFFFMRETALPQHHVHFFHVGEGCMIPIGLSQHQRIGGEV